MVPKAHWLQVFYALQRVQFLIKQVKQVLLLRVDPTWQDWQRLLAVHKLHLDIAQLMQLLLYKVAVLLHPPQTLFELQNVHPDIEHVKQVRAFWL